MLMYIHIYILYVYFIKIHLNNIEQVYNYFCAFPYTEIQFNTKENYLLFEILKAQRLILKINN